MRVLVLVMLKVLSIYMKICKKRAFNLMEWLLQHLYLLYEGQVIKHGEFGMICWMLVFNLMLLLLQCS